MIAAIATAMVLSTHWTVEACEWAARVGPGIELECPPRGDITGDFAGDGGAELVLVGTARDSGSVVVLAVRRSRNRKCCNLTRIGEWSRGTAPTRLEVVQRGRYERAPPYNRARAEDEVEQVDLQGEGLLFTFPDGRRRLYFLADGTWKHVYLGFEHE